MILTSKLFFAYKNNEVEARFKLPKGSFSKQVKKQKINPSLVKVFMIVDEHWPAFVKAKNFSLLKASPYEIDQQLLIDASRKIQQPYYHIFEVFLPFYSLPNTIQEIQQHLREFSKFMKSEKGKKSIRQVAYAYSSAPSAASGGNLGWLTKKDLPAKLKARVSKLAKGSIIGPLREKNGFRFYFIDNTTDRLAATTADDKSDIYSFIELTYTPSKDLQQISLNKTNQELLIKLAKVDNITKAKALKRALNNKMSIKITEDKEASSLDTDLLAHVTSLNEFSPTSTPVIQNGVVKIYHLISHITSANKNFLRRKARLEIQHQKLNTAFCYGREKVVGLQ